MKWFQRVNMVLKKVPAWPIYVVGALPPFWYLYLGLTGGLGVDPTKTMEHKLGLLALQVLIAVMAITPIRNWTGVNLIKYRRALGLVVYYLVISHLLTWLILDVQIPSQIWGDIVKRPFITIGMAAFVLMTPVAITSNNLSIRKLGPKRWKRVHQLTYACILLGGIHYEMAVKGFRYETWIYVAIILFLLAVRIPFPKIGARLSRA